MDDDAGFLARWSRRKVGLRRGAPEPVGPAADPAAPPLAPPADAAARLPADAAAAPPPPTLEDVAALGRDDDIARFVRPGVDSAVRSAALKKLFTDPRFNLMDGLDTYVDDYSLADPLPAGWLQKMAQSRVLGLLSDDEEAAARTLDAAAAAATPPPTCELPADENPDLRLQPDDAAGCPGPAPGPAPDPGREP